MRGGQKIGIDDLAGARAAEQELAELLSADPRVEEFEEHTADFDRLDYSFTYDRGRVHVDLKEKRQRYSAGYAEMWDVPPQDMFIVDETVYRRIVWQGGGGYLVIHDHPEERWAIFGPWELTLGPRVRYQRWGHGRGRSFLKGKLLLDLKAAARLTDGFSVDDLLRVIERSRAARESVEAVATREQVSPRTGLRRLTVTGPG